MSLDTYRVALQQKAEELHQYCALPSVRETIAIERCPDPSDEITLQLLRDLQITNIDTAELLLQRVDAALVKFKEGTYGLCEKCEEPIASERLKAVPWAEHCIGCANAKEQQRAAGVREEYDSVQEEAM